MSTLPPAPLYVNSLWLERLRECGLQPASCAQKGLLAPKKKGTVLQCFPILEVVMFQADMRVQD